MEATGASATVPHADTAISDVNAVLAAEAPGSYVYRAADGKRLVLHVKKERGLVVIFN